MVYVGGSEGNHEHISHQIWTCPVASLVWFGNVMAPVMPFEKESNYCIRLGRIMDELSQ
jgi:hypothetical protein